MKSYAFILCPPYCGSTLITKILGTSRDVSLLPGEGQWLPEVKDVMRKDVWDEKKQMPWGDIKRIWAGYWDVNKPVWVEKSPPNIVRAQEIERVFEPSYFIVMVRNPYAHCEGLRRRNRWDIQRCANFAGQCLTWQMNNVQRLTHTLHFKYEDIVHNPAEVCEHIQQWLPGLKDHLDPHQSFELLSVDGFIKRGITDLNIRKIDNLTMRDIKIINHELSSFSDAMNFWGYRMIELRPAFLAGRYRRKLVKKIYALLDR